MKMQTIQLNWLYILFRKASLYFFLLQTSIKSKLWTWENQETQQEWKWGIYFILERKIQC